MNQRSRDAITKLVSLLVSRDYSAIERMTGGTRASASDLERTVMAYGRTLAMPPDSVKWMDVIEVEHATLPTWSVTCTLWTDKEGRSDLSLKLSLTEFPDRTSICLDDLHVP